MYVIIMLAELMTLKTDPMSILICSHVHIFNNYITFTHTKLSSQIPRYTKYFNVKLFDSFFCGSDKIYDLYIS
jgi:hypothetical protein